MEAVGEARERSSPARLRARAVWPHSEQGGRAARDAGCGIAVLRIASPFCGSRLRAARESRVAEASLLPHPPAVAQGHCWHAGGSDTAVVNQADARLATAFCRTARPRQPPVLSTRSPVTGTAATREK